MGLEALATTAKYHALRAMVITWILGFAGVLLMLSIQWFIGPSPLNLPKIVIAAVVSTLFQMLMPIDKIGAKHVQKLAARQAQGRLVNIAEEMAIATGHTPGSVLIHDSEIPNVGGFPTPDGIVVVATTGAVNLLERSELQALVAAQFAGLEDPWCKRAIRAEVVWRLTAIGCAFSGLFSPAIFLFALVMFLPRWVEHDRDLCADVAAVRATMHPDALATGLRDLRPAARSAHKLEVGSTLLSASPFLVLPKRSESRTTVGEGNGAREWTSADEIASDLGLRADRAEQLAAGGNPREFTGREFRRRHGKLGTAPTLTKDEEKQSVELAERQGVGEQNADPIDLAKRHYPADHEFWALKEKAEDKQAQLGFSDIAQYGIMVANLQKLEAERIKGVAAQAHATRTPPPPQAATAIAAGWYADPQDPSQWRWWDGNGWTANVQQARAA